MSVKYRPIFGRMSVKYRPRVDRVSSDMRVGGEATDAGFAVGGHVGQSIDRHSTDRCSTHDRKCP